MEPFHKLIVLFGSIYPFRISSGPRLNSLKYSPLKVLPIELIMSIAESLPLQAAVSFTLTCRPIWNILGNHYLNQLKIKGNKPDRLAFLDFWRGVYPNKSCATTASFFITVLNDDITRYGTVTRVRAVQ